MKSNHNLFRMIKFFFKCKKAAYFTIFMIMLGLVVGITTPMFNELIVNDVIPGKNFGLFVNITLVILMLNLISALSGYFTSKTLITNCISISSKIREDLIEMNIYNSKHKKDKGKVLIAGTTFIEDANLYYLSYMQLIFDSILKVCFYVPLFIFYGKHLSLIMLGFAILSFFFIAFANNMATKHMKKSRLAEAEASDYVLKMLKEIENPNFEENETYNVNTYISKVEARDKSWLGYCNWANAYTCIFNFIWYIGAGICFCLAHNMLLAGTLSIGIFVVFNSYLDQVKAPICSFLSYKLMGVRFNETFQKIFDLLEEDKIDAIPNEKSA